MSDVIFVDAAYIVKEPSTLGGAPHIVGRRVGVHDVVNICIRLGGGVDEAVTMFALTPAQVHAALAYYYDHPEEVNAILAENARLTADYGADKPALLGRDANPEMTAAEIAAVFGITARAVRSAAERGLVPARKSGATWRIRRLDAKARWGHRGD